MNYILFEDNITRNNLLPLTFMRPVADIRVGILTIREKWEKYLKVETSTLTESHLSIKFPIKKEANNVLINGSILPNAALIKQILKLEPNQAIVDKENIVAMHITDEDLDKLGEGSSEGIDDIFESVPFTKINFVWDIYLKNDEGIQSDFELLTKLRKSQELSPTNTLLGNQLFIEKGAKIEGAILNTNTGPIYIGRDAEVMEGAVIRGPFALCEHGVVKMAAKIYGATTVGPYSKVGGEVTNSVIFGYSNKAHDGFMGHSVIGEWCNIGADTNTSNLKNTYDSIRLWNYKEHTFINTCQQFCGLIMGDHSKTGINVMFNSGTVIGVNVNVFGAGFQRNFIPSFTWGGTAGHEPYKLRKALDVAAAVYARRDMELNEVEKDLLTAVYHLTLVNKRL